MTAAEAPPMPVEIDPDAPPENAAVLAWLPLPVLARLYDKHPDTFLSWVKRGVKYGNGDKRIKLRAVRLGGRWVSTMYYVKLFTRELAKGVLLLDSPKADEPTATVTSPAS
jgi:hypothetical protein